MQQRAVALLFILALVSMPTQGVVIHIDAQATWNGSLSRIDTLLPPPTILTASVDLDIGPGIACSMPVLGAAGSFNWTHGTFGAQSFSVTGARRSVTHSAGIISFWFSGFGPTLSGVLAESFLIAFDIGGNPFTPPESSTQLSDLILHSSVSYLGIGRQEGPSTV